MKKILFLAAFEDDAQAMLGVIRRYRGSSGYRVVIAAYEPGAQRVFQKYSIPFKTTIDYLGHGRLWNVLSDSLYFARKWCELPEIEKVLQHKGISLGRVLEQNIWHLFQSYLNDIELLKSVIEDEKPDMIFLRKRKAQEINSFYINDEEIYDIFFTSLIAQKHGIPIEWISSQNDTKTNISKQAAKKINAYFKASIKQLGKLKNSIRKTIHFDHGFITGHISLRLRNIFLNSRQVDKILKNFAIKKSKICFFPDLRCAENLIHLLRLRAETDVICLKSGKGRSFIKPGVLSIGLSEFSNREIKGIVANRKNDLLKILDCENVNKHFEKLFNYQGVYFWPVVKEKIKYILSEHLPSIINTIECTYLFDKTIGIDFFISTSDRNAFVKSIMQTLHLNGKHTLVMQHGMECLDEQISKVYGKIMVPTFANKKATWGEATKEWQIKHGDKQDCLEVTSCPDFDSYFKINYSKDYLRRVLRIRPDKKIIHYGLTHANRGVRVAFALQSRDEVLQHLRDIVSELSAHPEFHLIIRPCPADRHPEEIEEIVRLDGGTNITIPRLELIDELLVSDIVVTYSSAIALQGMILGKDAVVYNPTGRPESATYVKEGVALRVTKKSDLAPTLINILQDKSLRAALAEKRKKYIQHCAGEIDGNASERLVDLIYRMLNRQNSIAPKISIEKDHRNVVSKNICA